jgi:hypothetical protein
MGVLHPRPGPHPVHTVHRVSAAVRCGPAASTVSLAVAIGFMVSGMVSVFLLTSPMNMLASTLPDVLFSFAVGGTLLVLGAYGRISGGLPADSPYASGVDEPAFVSQAPRGPDDVGAAAELASAERARARHGATPEQLGRLAEVDHQRSSADRRRVWRDTVRRPGWPGGDPVVVARSPGVGSGMPDQGVNEWM